MRVWSLWATHDKHTHVHTHTHTHTHTCTHTHTRIHTHTHTRVRAHTHTNAHTHTHAHTRTHTCARMHTQTHAQTHTYTHARTHTHTQMETRSLIHLKHLRVVYTGVQECAPSVTLLCKLCTHSHTHNTLRHIDIHKIRVCHVCHWSVHRNVHCLVQKSGTVFQWIRVRLHNSLLIFNTKLVWCLSPLLFPVTLRALLYNNWNRVLWQQ